MYPAELSGGAAAAYTSNPRYATPVPQATAGRSLTFTFGPRHATDLLLFETPGPQDDWQRTVIRINNACLSGIVIEWAAP